MNNETIIGLVATGVLSIFLALIFGKSKTGNKGSAGDRAGELASRIEASAGVAREIGTSASRIGEAIDSSEGAIGVSLDRIGEAESSIGSAREKLDRTIEGIESVISGSKKPGD